MFIRVKSTPKSPRRSIQIVESKRIDGKESLSYSEYLLKLFEYENKKREIRGKEMVLKMAGLPKVNCPHLSRPNPNFFLFQPLCYLK